MGFSACFPRTKQNLLVLSVSQINTLEDTLGRTNGEYNQRLVPLYRALTKLEANLRDMRTQLEDQKELNDHLLTVKMKLEKEIETYRELIGDITAENER